MHSHADPFLSCMPSHTRLHLTGHSMVHSILQYSYCTEDKSNELSMGHCCGQKSKFCI